MSLGALIAAMILQLQPAAMTPVATPKRPALAAFESLCLGTRDADDAAARALTLGWVEQQPDRGSELALLVNLHRPDVRGRTFVAGEGQQRVHLWTRGTEPVRTAECTILIFDVDDPEAILADVIAWRNRAPDVSVAGTAGDEGRAVSWLASEGEIITASIERLPCPTGRGCRKPRFVIQQSRELPE